MNHWKFYQTKISLPDLHLKEMLHRRIILQLAASIALLLLLVSFLPDFPVWITDNGNKYIVTENISRYNTGIIQHPYPDFFPSGGFHFVHTTNGFRSFYLEYLARLSVLPKKLLGNRGLLFWPFASTCLLIWLLLSKFKHHSQISWVTVFSSPIVFYTFLCWESTPAILIVVLSGIMLHRKKTILAGLVLGSGLILREELYIVFLCIILALLINRKKTEALRYVIGFLIPATIIWFYQYLEFGHILGLHGAKYRSNNNTSGFSIYTELPGILWNYYHHLLRFDATESFWDYLPIPLLAGMILCGCRKNFSSNLLLKKILLTCNSLITIILTAWLFKRDDLAYAAALTTGLLPNLPIIWGLLANWRPMLQRHGKIRILTCFTIAYVLFVPPLLTRSDIGLIWGARHFLYIMPGLFILSWLALKSCRMQKFYFMLAGTGIMIQCFGYYALHQTSHEADELKDYLLSQNGKIIVNDVFFIPEETPELFFKKTILSVNEKNIAELPKVIQKSGENSFTLVLSAKMQFRNLSNPALAKLLEMFPPTAEPMHWKRTTGGGFIDLFIVRCSRLLK